MFVEGPPSPGFAAPQGHATGDNNHNKGFTPRSRQNSGVFNRDENNTMVRSLHTGRRPPQRSRTTHEHIPSGPQVLTLTVTTSHSRPHTPGAADISPAALVKGREAQSASVPTVEQQTEGTDAVTDLQRPARRLKLGKPRRSYSVMDYEPVLPPWQRRTAPGARLTFTGLPTEMLYAFFDFLDPIDATCLGLANKQLYAIHRRLHGSVPLSVRRDGPNELEWAWHRAAYPAPEPALCALTPCYVDDYDKAAVAAPAVMGNQQHLTALRVRGKGLCRKCGVSRCELHKHIVEWMPAEYEYCSVRDQFVPSPEGKDVAAAKKSCYRSNPTNNSRCGRHRVARRREEAGRSSSSAVAA